MISSFQICFQVNNLTTKNSSLKHQIARMEEDQSRLQVIYDAQDMTPADLQVRELRNTLESVGRERRGRVDGGDCYSCLPVERN